MSTYKSVDHIVEVQLSKIHKIQSNMKLLTAVKSNTQILTDMYEHCEQLKRIELKTRKLKEAFRYQVQLCRELKESEQNLHSLMKQVEKVDKLIRSNNVENVENCTESTNSSTNYEYSPGDEPFACIQRTTIKGVHLGTALLEIEPLSQEEYTALPKYMLGRLTLETINKFVDIINHAITSKYELLKKSKFSLKPKDKLLYENYKREETPLTKGKYFVTGADIAKLQGLKNLEKRSYSILAILRHTKRISELRSSGIVRYVI